MAPSHSWGSSQIIPLTAKTNRRLKEGISQSELPLTFPHALPLQNGSENNTYGLTTRLGR